VRKPTLTDALTALAALAAVGAAVAFAASSGTLAGVLLATALALAVLLVRSVARDLGRQHARTTSSVAEIASGLRRVERTTQDGLAKTDQVVVSVRRMARVAISQGDRVEERTDAMSRRILADLNASRLQAQDAAVPPAVGTTGSD